MKQLLLLLLAATLLASCTKVDNGKISYITHQIEVGDTLEIPLSATRADTVVIRATLLLSDILEAPYIARLLSASFDDGSVAVEGLDATGRHLTLDSLCLTVYDRANNIHPLPSFFHFGDISADRTITRSPAPEFLRSLFFCFDNRAYNLDISIFYITNDAFGQQDNIRLKIRLRGTFDYAELLDE
ncbi:MAG: hypothetical protein LBF19_02250 [Prevotellaceae bacterium]|jgi:hypothetical protein|nr:hypothetical protein [Prevotellaceae bacterium]